MRSHPFRLVVFDFDGTLVDSQGAIVQAMEQAFLTQDLPPPEPAAVRHVVGLKLEPAIARLLPEDAGWETAQRVAAAYREAFFALRSQPDFHEPLFPGVHETLARLNRPEVCLGIATGKNRRGLLLSFERHGLAGYFVTLQTADDGPGKPHPELVRRAMAETGTERHETVLVGDTTYDMEMARNAGVAGIGVAWGYHESKELIASGAARVIESFHELHPSLSVLGTQSA